MILREGCYSSGCIYFIHRQSFAYTFVILSHTVQNLLEARAHAHIQCVQRKLKYFFNFLHLFYIISKGCGKLCNMSISLFWKSEWKILLQAEKWLK